MQPDTSDLVPAIQQLQNQPTIGRYLNLAIALAPPLCVQGQPPLLHIYLPTAHLSYIGSLLPRLEAALRSLQGSKYWDVYVFAGEPEASPRLIYHTLIERAPSAIALPPLAEQPPTMATATSPIGLGAVPQPPPLTVTGPAVQSAERSQPSQPVAPRPLKLPPTPPAVPHQLNPLTMVTPPPTATATPRWPHRLATRRRTVQRRRLVLGASAITGLSFALGTLASVGSGWWQARRSQPTAPVVETSSLPLEPATDQADPPVETPSASPPVSPNSLIDPIASPSGMSVAAGSLAVPANAQVAVQLKAVGDVIPGTDFPNYRLPQDPNYLFNSVKMFMGEVDLLFGNFESTLTSYPYTAKNVGQGMTFAFRTPPNWTDVLKSAGFDVLSVANNHSFDFGDQGFDDTIANIQQSGMQAVGRKGDIVMAEANGYTVAFIGYSYWPDHNDMNDLATATALVQQAQAEADMVVISVHAGAEGTDAMHVRNQTEYFLSENRGNMVHFSRSMIDAGADLILGHGPHVPRAVELYQGKLIAYSLGNFLGYRTLSTQGPLGLSMILQVDLTETGDFIKGRVIPVALDKNGVPYIDNGFASVTLMRQLTAQDFPETPLRIDEMGYILRTDQP